MLGPAVHRGNVQHTRLWRPRVRRMGGPNNFGRAAQADPTLLRYASTITEQKKLGELVTQKFHWFQTLRNISQQHTTGCANGRNV